MNADIFNREKRKARERAAETEEERTPDCARRAEQEATEETERIEGLEKIRRNFRELLATTCNWLIRKSSRTRERAAEKEED